MCPVFFFLVCLGRREEGGGIVSEGSREGSKEPDKRRDEQESERENAYVDETLEAGGGEPF